MLNGKERESLLRRGIAWGLSDIISLRQFLADADTLRQLLAEVDSTPEIASRPDYEGAPWMVVFVHDYLKKSSAPAVYFMLDESGHMVDEFGCPVAPPGVTPLPPGPEHLVRRGW